MTRTPYHCDGCGYDHVSTEPTHRLILLCPHCLKAMTRLSWRAWADTVTTVGSLGRLVPEGHPDYERIVFVDGDDREAVRRYTGAEAEDYGSFFVLVGDGEYDAVWGMDGIVPGNHKPLTRIL